MIRIENLVKQIQGKKVLRGISLEVTKGETVVIVGPSGGGKTTFLRCLNFLESPDQGKIWIDQTPLDHESVGKLRPKIGMVFQHFNLFPHLTVLDNIIFPLMSVQKLPFALAREKAFHELCQVGVGDKATAYPSQLSGGQKQRAAIARTLALTPEVILFDEPTSALDPEKVKDIADLIENLTQKKMTSFIVTHSMGFARKVGTRILYFREGQVHWDTSKEEFFNAPIPEVKRFLESMLF